MRKAKENRSLGLQITSDLKGNLTQLYSMPHFFFEKMFKI